jgi:hypothetical protein
VEIVHGFTMILGLRQKKKEESEKEYRTLDCHLPTLEVLN